MAVCCVGAPERLVQVRKPIALAVCILLFVVGISARADFDAGFAAYDQGDYATALEHWLPLAEAGDGAAQNWLGRMYAFGKGVPRDVEQAMIWFRRSADQGHAEGQWSLGKIYHEGRLVPQDVAEGLRWLNLAANQGDAAAQYDLGMIYCTGDGVKQDLIEGHMWLNLAAAQTHTDISAFARMALTQADVQMTMSQIARAEQLARKWMATHPEFMWP